MWGISCVALSLLAAQAGAARAAEDQVVETERQGERVMVRARALVAAPVALVWEVLTDYERLPRFIPGITRSVVLQREVNRVVLEQSGQARFLLFSFPIEVRYEVLEQPSQRVVSNAVAGNLRHMTGRYEIQPSGDGVLLRYYGEIEPNFDLPPLVGTAVLRGMVEEQFNAMVAEIERRR